jgi:hypothetical protein
MRHYTSPFSGVKGRLTRLGRVRGRREPQKKEGDVSIPLVLA